MKIFFVAVFTGVMLLGTFKPPRAEACSCAAPWTVQDALKESHTVFRGTVIEIKEIRRGTPWRKEVTFEADEFWKGTPLSSVTIRTNADSAGCGYEFSTGREYLVYAHESEELYLSVTLCSRTAERSAAKEDLKELGAGIIPSENTPQGKTYAPSFAVIGAALAGLLGIYIILKKR